MPRRTSKPTKKQRKILLDKEIHTYEWTVDEMADPWAAVDAIVKREVEPTGPEWFTAEQFADRYKLSARQAWSICNRLVKEGKFRHWKGTAANTRRITNKYAPA